MKYKSPLFLLIFCFFSLNAIAISDSTFFIKYYYPEVNRAEIFLINKSYRQAINIYKDLEKNSPYILSKDLYNAFECSVYLKDFDFAYLMLEKLQKLGFNQQQIAAKAEFKAFFLSNFGKRFTSNLNNNSHIYTTIDTLYRRQLKKLFETDQYFRLKNVKGKSFEDTIRKVDKHNIYQLLHLIDTKGFPSEAKIGIDGKIEPMQNFWVVVLHQAAYNDYEVKQKIILHLRKASINGEIDPHVSAFIEEHLWGSDKYKTKPIFKVTCENTKECYKNKQIREKVGRWVHNNYTEEEKLRINNNRHNIGLENLNDFYRKIYFGMNNKNNFYFKYLGGKVTYQDCDLSAALLLLKNAVVLK